MCKAIVIGKLTVLSLEDCESEDENEGSEEEDSETQDEDDDADISITSNVSHDLSQKSYTFSDFIKQSNTETFLGLGSERVDLILEELKVYIHIHFFVFNKRIYVFRKMRQTMLIRLWPH